MEMTTKKEGVRWLRTPDVAEEDEESNIVQVTEKSVYGNTLVYPVNETARLLVKLTRRTTLSDSDIATIQQLGYEISLVNVSTRKWQ